MTRITILTIFSLGLFHFISAQEPLSLEQAIKTGLENNFQIQISEKQTEIASNNNSWGQAGAYPTITFGARMGADGLQYTDSFPDYNATQLIGINPSVELNWMVFNGFRIKTTKAQLAVLQEQTQGNAAIVVENTLQSIILAYHLAKLNEETLKVTEEVFQLSRDRYNYMLSKKDLGSAVTFDVLQAKNNYLTDSANVLQQRLNYDNSFRNLNLVLVQPAGIVYSLSSENEFDKNMKEFVLSELITKMESNNKTLQNQYLYQEILKKNTRLNQSQLYPSLMLRTSFGEQIGGAYADWEQTTDSWSAQYNYSLNFVLSWKLSDGGNVRRAIKNSQIEEDIGQIRTDELKRTMLNILLRTFEDYNIKRQLKNVSELRVESASLNLQIAEEKFKSGAINSFNYRDIQVVYLNAARGLLHANYNLVDSYTELLRLTGGIVTEFAE